MNTFFTFFFICTFSVSASHVNPVIISLLLRAPNVVHAGFAKSAIPDFTGSRINVLLDEDAEIHPACRLTTPGQFTMWMDTKYLFWKPLQCLAWCLPLTYDDGTRTTNNFPGVQTFIPGFGDTSSIEIIDVNNLIHRQFSHIVERLKKEGYESGHSIRGAPYDWRKGRTLIEETYENNHQLPIVLMVYGLGAPVSRVFLNQQSAEWKDKYIRFEISLAGAWAGTVKAIEIYLLGYVLRFTELLPSPGAQIDLKNPLLKILHKAQTLTLIRSILSYSLTLVTPKVMRSFPSIVWQFPSSSTWDDSQILVQTAEHFYTIEHIEELFDDLDRLDGKNMYNDIREFINNQQDPEVNLHCIYGTGIPTVEMVTFEDKLDGPAENPTNGDGDGFINLKSLEACKLWAEGRKTVAAKSFHGVSHAVILSNSEVLDYMINLIKET